MAKLPAITGKELARVATRIGFAYHHTTGSHMVFRHIDGRVCVIPSHAGEEIGPGLLLKIIKKEFGITRKEFETIIRGG